MQECSGGQMSDLQAGWDMGENSQLWDLPGSGLGARPGHWGTESRPHGDNIVKGTTGTGL